MNQFTHARIFLLPPSKYIRNLKLKAPLKINIKSCQPIVMSCVPGLSFLRAGNVSMYMSYMSISYLFIIPGWNMPFRTLERTLQRILGHAIWVCSQSSFRALIACLGGCVFIQSCMSVQATRPNARLERSYQRHRINK